jgi:hypothetical protein
MGISLSAKLESTDLKIKVPFFHLSAIGEISVTSDHFCKFFFSDCSTS